MTTTKRKPIKVKRPGDLRRRLGAKKGQKISDAKAKAAEKKPGLEGKEARYYENVLKKGSKTSAARRKKK